MTVLEKVLILYKEMGETPLERLIRFKSVNPIYKDIPMTYAGRLDPVAEGLLLVLGGEECKKREEYLKMPKTYELEILFGLQSDTNDILGKIESQNSKIKIQKEKFEEIVKKFIGKINQEYPFFSSKPYLGKPLFEWARQGIEKIITHEVEIYSINLEKIEEKNAAVILEEVKKRIDKVKGDFRQSDVLKSWECIIEKNPDQIYTLCKIEVNCGTGTYMRMLARDIGRKLGTEALAYKIKRTKIGEWSEVDVENIW